MFDFLNYDFTKTFDHKFLQRNLGGTPILAPQSAATPKMTTPAQTRTPLFIAESFSECGCLQKTRAHSVNIWPRYKGFKSKKNIFKKISFVRLANEKRRKSAGFQDCSEIFSLHGKLLPPYSICGWTCVLDPGN